MTKRCNICGTAFVRKGNAKTCSVECSEVLYRLRCPGNGSGKWRPSPETVERRREYQRAYRQRRLQQRGAKRICVVCGRPCYRQGGLICSPECSAKQAEARHQAYQLAAKERASLREAALRERQQTARKEHLMQRAALRALRELGIRP